MKTFIALVCLILGAVLNSFAERERIAGIREGLEMTVNRLAEDYTEFALHRARIEAFINDVCRDSFYRRARMANIEGVCGQ